MILQLTGLVMLISATEAVVCREDVDCAADECCYIEPEFLVVSRRQLDLPLPNRKSDTGVCEKYRQPDDPCGPLEVLNGHCGCTTGYPCQFVPEPSTALPTKIAKRKILMPGPGAYQCTPEQ